jgi:hypothetical protein
MGPKPKLLVGFRLRARRKSAAGPRPGFSVSSAGLGSASQAVLASPLPVVSLVTPLVSPGVEQRSNLDGYGSVGFCGFSRLSGAAASAMVSVGLLVSVDGHSEPLADDELVSNLDLDPAQDQVSGSDLAHKSAPPYSDPVAGFGSGSDPVSGSVALSPLWVCRWS